MKSRKIISHSPSVSNDEYCLLIKPSSPGSNLWMSPDGGMVAIPPNGAGSGNPPRPPMPMWGMGGMGGRGAGMGGMGQPFAGAPVMYPLNYPMFYPHPGPPR